MGQTTVRSRNGSANLGSPNRTDAHMRACIRFCILTMALAAGTASADELAGTWTLTLETPRGIRHPTLEIRTDGESHSGVYNSARGPLPIDNISVDGNTFSFPLTLTMPIGEIEVSYQGSIDGDDMTGVVTNPRGEVPFTGKRTAP